MNTNIKNQTLEAIKYKNGQLELLDQLRLPHETHYLKIEKLEDGWNAINKMNVRGAPAIAIAGILTVAVQVELKTFETAEELHSFVNESMKYLITSRPTAVNISDAAHKLDEFCSKTRKQVNEDLEVFKQRFIFYH
jgi:methylthioribose-1-phosphate isomerase